MAAGAGRVFDVISRQDGGRLRCGFQYAVFVAKQLTGEIVQQMIADGWYAGGSRVGTHWLFADRFGTILRIAQNSVEEKHWFHRDGLVFLARGETPAAKQMQAASGKLSIRDFHEAAKSPDICFGSSISGLTVRIDPRKALAGGTVWAALPAWSPSLPLYVAAKAVARPLADGACFKAGARLLALRDSTSSIEFGRRLVFHEDFRVELILICREFQTN